MTSLLYIDNPHLYETFATFLSSGSDEKGEYLTTDKTIFYPQGGGQPSDHGLIKAADITASIHHVGFSDGVVRHYIDGPMAKLAPGASLQLFIDADRRQLNSRLHTGGHLVTHVVESTMQSLNPTKGYHFPEGSYVEFDCASANWSPDLIPEINRKLAVAVMSHLQVASRLATFSEALALRPNLAPLIPRDKPTRIVQIGEFLPLPCGGTHIESVDQLGSIQVTKTKQKKATLRISYEISQDTSPIN